MNTTAFTSPPLRWLVLDLNSFFASCEQQENPALKGRPIAVVPMLAETTCVIAASYEAKATGIKTGTLVKEAKRMCPSLILRQARPKLYVEYHHRILEAIETCAPIEDVMSIDEVACRLDRFQQNPEEAKKLAIKMKRAIIENVGSCLTSSVGIASNRLLAKLASDMQKPDGLTVLDPALMPRPILHLKLNDICGIGPRMLQRLQAAGIYDVASLWAADSAQLRRVWNGVMGARFFELLHGKDLPSPARPQRSMGHQHVLAPEQRSMAAATPVIRQLLVRATERLRREGFYTKRLILEIKWGQDCGYSINEQTFHETTDTLFLLRILMKMWDEIPQQLKPLRIGIVLADLATVSRHQFDLFEQKQKGTLQESIDNINKKFGRGTVAFGSVENTLTSKIAFQRVPHQAEF